VAASESARSPHGSPQVEPREADPSPGAGQEAPPSDSDLKAFAEIYGELQEADAKFDHDMASARTRQEAQAVMDARNRAADEALTSHGWTRTKFDRVASAIDRDPALIERAIELFEEDS
jgi:hypothetical protein